MKIKQIFCIIFLLSCLTKNAAASIGKWVDAGDGNKNGQVRILSSFYEDANQQKKLIIGLQFKIADGWHVYGNEAGGIGLPPSVDFKGSSNYASHKISWPQAISKEEKIGAESIKYSVYENEVILPVEIDLKDAAKDSQLKIKLNYGLCKDICVPASAEFVADISSNETDEKSLTLIQKFFDKKISEQKQMMPAVAESKMPKGLVPALIAAFIGGFILNLMPCVLPVLGIKLMSIINHQGARVGNIRFAFFATLCGIVACFAVFALFAIIIKFTGNIFGWGLQFQNPYFLVFLIALLFAFIANMLGFFEINFDQFLANFLNRKISKNNIKTNIFMPNFLSGILAVLLATPCSAPFLGSAISFSITQNNSIIFLIFVVMSLGLALPYIALMISPQTIYLLPKPGNWMLQLKRLMALLLLSTVAWLIYVLSNNLSAGAGITITVIGALFLLTFKIEQKTLKNLALIVLIIATIIVPSSFKPQSKTMDKADMLWIDFDEYNLYTLVKKGNIVVVDVTADWCITCKFNKLHVFHDAEVVRALKEEGVVAMRADITQPDPAALSFIHKKGRYGIPFNIVYGPGAKDGLLASELLTKKELFDLIKKAK